MVVAGKQNGNVGMPGRRKESHCVRVVQHVLDVVSEVSTTLLI